MIRAALLVLAFVNILWLPFPSDIPTHRLTAALINVLAAVGVDLLNTAWKRARA